MIKNAIAYITRKRNRSLIILIILTLVLSCLYACLSISKSQETLEKSLYETSNSAISITKKDNNGYKTNQRYKRGFISLWGISQRNKY